MKYSGTPFCFFTTSKSHLHINRGLSEMCFLLYHRFFANNKIVPLPYFYGQAQGSSWRKPCTPPGAMPPSPFLGFSLCNRYVPFPKLLKTHLFENSHFMYEDLCLVHHRASLRTPESENKLTSSRTPYVSRASASAVVSRQCKSLDIQHLQASRSHTITVLAVWACSPRVSTSVCLSWSPLFLYTFCPWTENALLIFHQKGLGIRVNCKSKDSAAR